MFWVKNIFDYINFHSVIYKINSIRCYLRNRFFCKLHYLKTGLPAGEYNDLDERILYGLFNEFIIFIEQEKASMNFDYAKKNNIKFSWFFVNKNPEAGLDYLNWEINQKDNIKQSEQAEWELAAYNWWKFTRPNRPDPYIESGVYKFNNIFLNETELQKSKDAFKKFTEMENFYYDEDTKWLTELITRRRNLWT